jgi:hypothetical protein
LWKELSQRELFYIISQKKKCFIYFKFQNFSELKVKKKKNVQLFPFSSERLNKHRIFGIWGVRGMLYNTTFNNISVISWQAVLLVVETGENN